MNNTANGIKILAILLLVWTLVWACVFYTTLVDVSSVWLHSNTYMHCFFVIPIALYFANERKQWVCQVAPKPALIMVFPLILLQGLWLVGFVADVSLFMHAAVFGMLSSVIVLYLGFSIAKILWFPLVFVVFAIPIGEELVPYFQVITADMTVSFLQWSGVPVYRDGLFITIPSGLFEVAEACSGVRFFVACVVMGAVISYVSYTRPWKRVLFFILAVAFPILANGLRAYGTTMVGYLIDMKYAQEADHLVYGWGFFAFMVMVLVLASRIGSDPATVFLTDSTNNDVKNAEETSLHPTWCVVNWYPASIMSVLPIVFTAVAVGGLSQVDRGIDVVIDKQPGESVLIESGYAWKPVFDSADKEHLGIVHRPGIINHADTDVTPPPLDYYIAVHIHSHGQSGAEKAELISENNRLFDIKKWRYINAKSVSLITRTGTSISASLLHVGASNGKKRLILYWYLLPNVSSSNSVLIKVAQAANVLLGNSGNGAAIAISIPYDKGDVSKQDILLQYAENYADSLQNMVSFQ
ncbi:MAG: exosortase [Pseudomonadales bacterium]|nr:exosortase [Pseudomonadales bacterium]